MRFLAAALAVALSSGCALRAHMARQGEDARLDTVEIAGQVIRIHYEDERAAAQVRRSLERALPRANRWGRLEKEITITIHPSHAALEEAVHLSGYEWMKAWARYQMIDLQSPRTWSWLGAEDAEVEALLTHELTHCVIYQSAAGEWTWSHKGIPLWFQEGIASVTAGQGRLGKSLAELWGYYAKTVPVPGAAGGFPVAIAHAARGYVSQDGDPITDPEPLRQEQYEVVYGAAHRAFEFLLARYGEERVRTAISSMRQGRSFEQAFGEAFGISETAFASEFRRYVLWKGWR